MEPAVTRLILGNLLFDMHIVFGRARLNQEGVFAFSTKGFWARGGTWHTDLDIAQRGFRLLAVWRMSAPCFRSALPMVHDYACEYYKAELSGCVCVQFMTVRNNLAATKILKWWQERGV